MSLLNPGSHTFFKESTGRADHEEQPMQHYEALIIISSKITEEELPFVIDKVLTLIKKSGGEITLDKNLGKKKLAYSLKQNRYGFYALVEFNLPPENLKNVEKDLRLLEEVIRYQAVRAKIKTAKELEAERIKESRAKLERFEEEVKEEKKVEVAPKKMEKEPVLEPPKKKISLEELDEKLDKILDDDMIK